MSSYALVQGEESLLAAWETEGQVYYATLDPVSGEPSEPIAAPGRGGERRIPAVAMNDAGEVLLVWTEGTGWQRGGAVAWQVFDAQRRPTAEHGNAPAVPVWGSVTAVAEPDGGFTIVY